MPIQPIQVELGNQFRSGHSIPEAEMLKRRGPIVSFVVRKCDVLYGMDPRFVTVCDAGKGVNFNLKKIA